MKVYVDGKTYDAKDTAVVIIFESDKERSSVISQLSSMFPRNGQRLYAMYPNNKYSNQEIEDLFDQLELPHYENRNRSYHEG